MIRKLPNKNKWTLKSKKTGKLFGTFSSKKKAIEREKQIIFFKNVRKR
jgi:hypothetical protein